MKTKIKVQDHTFRFFTFIFSDVNKLVNIKQRLSTFFLLVLAMVIEGTVSQIFYSGPSFRFMCFQNLCSQFFLNVSRILA